MDFSDGSLEIGREGNSEDDYFCSSFWDPFSR